MSLTSTQAVLDFWTKSESTEAKEERREIEGLKKDIRISQNLIRDAISTYRKKKLKVRSKAAANVENPFAKLDDYASIESIRDAYGWELITEDKMQQLMELWDLRANAKSQSGIYRDRIIDMLTAAIDDIFNRFGDPIVNYDEKVAQMRKDAEYVAHENYKNDVERERAQYVRDMEK